MQINEHRHQPDTAERPPPNKETEVSSGWNPDHTFQSNEDMTAEMTLWKTRNKHAIWCDRDDIQTDMEYTYVTLVDKLNSRRGECSLLIGLSILHLQSKS